MIRDCNAKINLRVSISSPIRAVITHISMFFTYNPRMSRAVPPNEIYRPPSFWIKRTAAIGWYGTWRRGRSQTRRTMNVLHSRCACSCGICIYAIMYFLYFLFSQPGPIVKSKFWSSFSIINYSPNVSFYRFLATAGVLFSAAYSLFLCNGVCFGAW